ncbi:MAG: GNAT family N-acetyltransferase [Pseudomonadota bacterium]|nr:GNAT family N-acetyltransferase [Pseudomonadota bacterium]
MEYRQLCPDTVWSAFVSGDGEIDSWLRKKSHRDHAARKHIVTCARLDGEKDVIGFYALSTVVESVKSLPGVGFFTFGSDSYFPCLQLVYLAVDQPHQRKNHGTIIMGQLIRDFAEIGKIIGLPAMIVLPLNADAKRFYERLGFEPYPNGRKMFLPLQSAIATVEEAEQEIMSGK